MTPAIAQLTPPPMGPRRSPVKGATTQLSRKEAPLTPNTGVRGRTSATMLRAAKIEIKESFDIVLFGDVLEHMFDPERAIEKAKELACEMILCVPNSDFLGVKVLKCCGVNKMKSGILDENHVYSFNRRKIEEMIVDNGFKILDFASPAPRRFPGFYNHIIQLNPAFFGYQFIYRCKVVE